YMSPELVIGGRIDFRSDVFAVGVLLYLLTTGTLPFPGRNPHEVMRKIAEGKFAPPDQLNPQIGTGLGRIIARALARLLDARRPDMSRLREELCADLHAGGIDDPREELRRFFAAPDAWAETARPAIVRALVATGRAEVSRGRSAAALAHATRALALV